MAIKKVLLSKKINNTIYEIFPKTSADVVVYGESTVAATLAQFAQDLAGVYTKDEVYTKGETDGAIEAYAEALYNRIMGITEEDGATVKEAYDTLKEVAKWIDEHGEIAAGFTTDISALKTAVGVAPAEGVEGSGLLKAMAEAQAAIEANAGNIGDLQTAVGNLETAVGDANSGLVKAMADAQAAIEALEDDVEDHETRIGTLETTVGGAESGLVKEVNSLRTQVNSLIEVGGTKVEKSETNGNIKVDGVEVNVYEHPETHSAEMITETTDRNFVTADEKAAIASAAEIVVVSSQDEITDETNLYLVEITE